LLVGDTVVAALNLSHAPKSGDVSFATGFFSGDEIPGEATILRGCSVSR
jgi:hypothetical protein